MSDREAFEKWQELPEFCVFNERINAYIWEPYDHSKLKPHPHNALWLAWQNGAKWQAEQETYTYSPDGKMRINKNGNFGF
jgi:hypothetical protein